MAYGSPWLRRPPLAGRALLALSVALCALAALSTLSCSAASRGARFSDSLATIDRFLAQGRPSRAAFDRAARLASSGADWLSLLKRSLRAEAEGERGIASALAHKALAAAPEVEAVAFAAAYALLRTGAPDEALALFPKLLSRDARPQLWAECFLVTCRAGRLPRSQLTADNLGFAAAASATDADNAGGNDRLYVSAAVLSLGVGDRAAAKTWLQKAVGSGVPVPTELMWDCGLYSELASQPEGSASPADLCIMGDAAWETGTFDLAQERWARAISLNPLVSWKTYLKLALLAGEGTELQASYFSRMEAAFIAPDPAHADPGAVTAFAGYLARSGEDERARALLKPYGQIPAAGALALAIQGRQWSEDRLVAEAERFAARNGSSGDALAAALRILFERGRFTDVAVLYRTGNSTSLDYPYRWYYGAAIEAALGHYDRSIEQLEAGSSLEPGPVAPYALGLIHLKLGDMDKAIAAFGRADAETFDASTRCTVLTQLGRAQLRNGDRTAARASWQEAARANPRDAEAAALARQ
ncbi:MAG TPA: hypothetical protein VMC79_04265, partial [Rectinemataceae bacterium]|nr:hypothetical protein [Rectinemataceae bacterium]